MPLRFNPLTSQLDLVGSPGITGPNSSTDKAITRWNGTSGSIVQDSKALVQDGGAVQAQSFVGRKEIDDAVAIPQKHYMVASGLTIMNTGSISISQDSELILL